MSNQSNVKNFTRGGQITLHNIRMFIQIMDKVALLAALIFVLVTGWLCVKMTSDYERYVFGQYLWAETLPLIDDHATTSFIQPNGDKTIVQYTDIAHADLVKDIVKRMSRKILVAIMAGIFLGMITLFSISYYLRKKGEVQAEAELIKGDHILPADLMRRLIIKKKENSDLSLAKLPLIKGLETAHILFHGTTGSGKSNAIKELLDQIRKRGDRAIIYDKSCNFLEEFYQPKTDILLNPLDRRGQQWNLWAECRDSADFDNLAAAQIPMLPSQDPFWIHAARTIFSAAAFQMREDKDKSITKLLHTFELVKDDEEPSEGRGWRAQQPALTAVEPVVGAASSDAANAGRPRPSAAGGQTSVELEGERGTRKSRFASREPALAGLTADLNSIQLYLKGTEAETLVSEKIEKTAVSIKSVLATYLKSLKYVKEGNQPFSIREWIQKEKAKNWLFVTSLGDRHETLKPLITAWLDIAVNSLLSLKPNSDRRIWLILDELASLQQLPYLTQVLSESRKFGGCVVVGIQNYAQLGELYGHDGARKISSLLNTRFMFRQPDPEMAKWSASNFGETIIDEVREGLSYGANTMRDGVSINRVESRKPLLSFSEIMSLANLFAYVRLPGQFPVTLVDFIYKERKRVSAGFLLRDIDEKSIQVVDKLIEKSNQPHPVAPIPSTEIEEVSVKKKKQKKLKIVPPQTKVNEDHANDMVEG